MASDDQEQQPRTALEDQIASQADELQRMLDDRATRDAVHAAAEGLQRCNRLWIVGTGTSQHAAELGGAMFHEAGRSATPSPAMPFVDWAPVLGPRDGVIVISHTLETPYALSARAQAFLAGLTVVTITRRGAGLPDSIETVPKESSETYTVSYTTALLALGMLAHAMGSETITDAQLARIPEAVRSAIDDPAVDRVPRPERALVIAGVGAGSITGREGALKLREAARVLAEGYDAEYLLHGSAVPLDRRDGLVAIAPPQDAEGLLEGVTSAAERSGVATSWLREPDGLPTLLAQIPLTARLQRLALRFATDTGHDPDRVITGPWADERLWRIGLPDG
jgi:glucosamine--fructose-6-phosphate aminotransferase (isomerizing)